MNKIQVKVTNQYGVFEGFLNLPANTTEAEARETIQAIRDGINLINTLTIEDDTGAATVFPETVLRNSVISLKISG